MTTGSQEIVDNDELTAFVAATLRAISFGVTSAGVTAASSRREGHHSFDIPSKITFDIGVTAKRTSEAGGGLKVQVFSVGAGVDGKKVAESETVSRISFDVNWTYKSSTSVIIPSTQTAWNES